MHQISLILDNIRSAYNVGSIVRNAAAFGVSDIICIGITPYPSIENDRRLPHVSHKAAAAIEKTALDATYACGFRHFDTIAAAIDTLRRQGTAVYACELTDSARDISGFMPHTPAALILGSEVGGISRDTLKRCDAILQIPTSETKRSLNVASTSAIALYDFASKLEGGAAEAQK